MKSCTIKSLYLSKNISEGPFHTWKTWSLVEASSLSKNIQKGYGKRIVYKLSNSPSDKCLLNFISQISQWYLQIVYLMKEYEIISTILLQLYSFQNRSWNKMGCSKWILIFFNRLSYFQKISVSNLRSTCSIKI